jgi:hypothetical protein
MDSEIKCIYCDALNPKWAKAHVVPRLMGTFENQPTLLKRVCSDCDNEIGTCETLLAKCTIEAVLLKNIGIVGRHKDKSSPPFRRGNLGYPPIRMTIVLPGYNNEVRVEPIGDSKNVDILPQLILIDAHGNREEIAINNPDCISLTEWSLLVKKCLDGNIKELEAFGISNEQFVLIKHVFREFGITFDSADDTKISPFQLQVLAKSCVMYDKRYFQAIAKIAFHYFLLHSKVFKGSEEEFRTIRRFIRYGEGNEWDFLEKNSRPIAQDLSGKDRPPYYGHVLRTEITTKSISVCVQLFIGHDYKPEWYRVLLSQRNRRVFLQTEEFGHYYRYLKPEDRTGYDGVIEKITVAQILKIPDCKNPKM